MHSPLNVSDLGMTEMTVEKIERVISILSIERKVRGGKNKIEISTSKNGVSQTIAVTVDEAISIFMKLRQEMISEEDN